jgi:RNA polymerase sigma factor (sigma-70 family)
MTTPRNDVRLELKFKNARLWHLVFDEHDSVAAFCRHYGLWDGQVGRLLSLEDNPYRRGCRRGQLRSVAERLCEIARVVPEDLFPPSLYVGMVPSSMVTEIPADRLMPLSSAPKLLTAPAQEDLVSQNELARDLENVLATLPPREQKVVRMRFGLDNGDESALEVVAEALNVSAERVRQIEARALRRLRHPSRARRLRTFLEV